MNQPKTNKLEDSKLWQEAVSVMERAYKLSEEFPEESQYTLTYKLRGRSFDLTQAIAEAEGANGPRDIEWFYSQARTALFAMKNAYHVARKTDVYKVDAEEVVRLNKLLEQIDKQIAAAHDDVLELEQEEMKRRGLK